MFQGVWLLWIWVVGFLPVVVCLAWFCGFRVGVVGYWLDCVGFVIGLSLWVLGALGLELRVVGFMYAL